MSHVKNFTGLVVTYDDGSTVREKNNFYSTLLQKQCATNWGEIALKKVSSLELYWDGLSRVKIAKEDKPYISHSDWYFTHTATLDALSSKPIILCRNIGYKKDGVIHIFSVDEKTGVLRTRSKIVK